MNLSSSLFLYSLHTCKGSKPHYLKQIYSYLYNLNLTYLISLLLPPQPFLVKLLNLNGEIY